MRPRQSRSTENHTGNTMSLRLGDDAPDFTAETTDGEVSFHDYLGDGWGVLLP